jgi:hypothetical protein
MSLACRFEEFGSSKRTANSSRIAIFIISPRRGPPAALRYVEGDLWSPVFIGEPMKMVHHKTLRAGATLFIESPTRTLFVACLDEASAVGLESCLQDIDAKLEGFRLVLYREAFADGAFNLGDGDLM